MKLLKYLILAVVVLSIASCADLDINDNPNAIDLSDVSMSSLLPTTIEKSSAATYSLGRTAALVTHQTDNVSGDYYNEFAADGPWSTIYLRVLNNLKTLEDVSVTESSPAYAGVAKVLRAYNLGLLTDTWEDVPFSEALDFDNTLPSYDSQEAIYGMIQSILTDAISDLSSTSAATPGSDDLVYGGDLEKWTKVAHSLKARYMMHLSKRGGIDYTALLSEVDAGFADNGDDFQLIYTESNINPVHGIVLSNETGNVSVAHAEYIVNLMNGTIYPQFDPRLPKIGGNGGASSYRGVNSTVPETQISYNVNFKRESYYSTETAPVVMMSFVELKFIEAEAALNSNNRGRAYTAYRTGIKADMDRLGVSDDMRMAYMGHSSVDVGEAALSLEHIMHEKYIATFLGMEAWNDMRRHGFSDQIYKGFVEPIDPHFMNDQPAYRAVYPSSEQTRNAENAEAARRAIEQPMWKDM